MTLQYDFKMAVSEHVFIAPEAKCYFSGKERVEAGIWFSDGSNN